MSTTERGTKTTEAPAQYAEYPEYELSCVVDDADDPAEVTLFADRELEGIYTQWISIDVDHAVPLEETL